MNQANKSQVKILLSEDELQLPAIDDLCNKYHDWVRLCKEKGGGRKTRSANKRADVVYEEIMAFRLPPIKIKSVAVSPPPRIKSTSINNSNNNSTKSSLDGDSSESSSVNSVGPPGRILRPRCRTPSVSRQPTASPSTPTHQSIRAHMKRNLDSNPNSNAANVLSAALNQQHPSVSVTKIRQLLRADSAQKKREEEKERQEQVRLQRKAKEERAEAQKRQLLEERAITAKLNREKRLLHAAEVRKAREKNRLEQKLREEPIKKQNSNQLNDINDESIQIVQTITKPQPEPPKQKDKLNSKNQSPEVLLKTENGYDKVNEFTIASQKVHDNQGPMPKSRKMDETFQKNPEEIDNIEISICDETTDDQKKQPSPIAAWAKAPGLRDVVVAQYSRPEGELMREALRIFKGVKLPVNLDEIFGPNNAVATRYLCRTSSAVWSTPHRPLKRTTSDVLTPIDPKRPA